MKVIIDQSANELIVEGDAVTRYPLYSDEAFKILSHHWLKVGWNQKYTYTFSWLGRPVIQMPEDLIRLQEVIYRLQPDVIVEMGVAHGGSLIFYAGLCKILEKGRVIGVDIEIRPHNRKALESHFLFPYITLIESSSILPETVNMVRSLIQPSEKVLVLLDSNHTREHVRQELEMYHPLVTKDSYIAVADGVMQDLYDVPRGSENWRTDNPVEAVKDFLLSHPEFQWERPQWLFNESTLDFDITYFPSGWLKKIQA